MTFEGLITLALQTGVPMALIAFLSFYLFTKLIPKVIADFRDTLKEMHNDCQTAQSRQREDFLHALKEGSGVFWMQFEQQRAAHERQLKEDRDMHREEFKAVTDAIRTVTDAVLFQTGRIEDTKAAVEKPERERHERWEQEGQERDRKERRP